MKEGDWTAAERRFGIWMLISAWMYGLCGLFFLFFGRHVPAACNLVSERFFPSLPPYPLSPAGNEGAFWVILTFSMMAMITWISRAAYIAPRANARLVPALLLSKFCSSAVYLAFFIADRHLAYLVGFATDAPLFAVTLALWLPAAPGKNFISATDEDIIAALGDALMPPGGAFEPGWLDFKDDCIADARRIFAAQDPFARFSVRLMLRILDAAPVFTLRRARTLRRLSTDERIAFLEHIERARSPLRSILTGVRFFALYPFFNRAETALAIGYDPAGEALE